MNELIEEQLIMAYESNGLEQKINMPTETAKPNYKYKIVHYTRPLEKEYFLRSTSEVRGKLAR